MFLIISRSVFVFLAVLLISFLPIASFTSAKDECVTGNNTLIQQHSFQVGTNSEVRVIWLGANQSSMIILSLNKIGPSVLFLSFDQGKTLVNQTNLLNLGSITNFVELSNENGEQMVHLTLELNGNSSRSWSMHITNENCTAIQPLAFKIHGVIQSHPHKPWMLLVLGEKYPESLVQGYISNDSGLSWNLLMANVLEVQWDPLPSKNEENLLLYLLANTSGISNESKKGFDLIRTAFNSSTFTVIAQSVKSFIISNKFIYADFYSNHSVPTLKVSTSKGRVWNSVQFLNNKSCNPYKILDTSEGIVFIHCGGSTGNGVLYASDSDGIIFSQLLDQHIPDAFIKIHSMRGTYFTHQKRGNSTSSVATYDQGSTWSMFNCNSDSKDECYLGGPTAKVPLLLTSPMTTESIADLPVFLSQGMVDPKKPNMVFCSYDGGFSWFMVFNEPHLFHIGLRGGLLVAIAKSPDHSSDLRYTTNDGDSFDDWNCLHISSSPTVVSQLVGQCGGHSSQVAVVSYSEQIDGWKKWTVTFVNFKPLFPRLCSANDSQPVEYAENITKFHNACKMGLNETIPKLKMDAKCLLENENILLRNSTVCPCEQSDFECDFGFYKENGTNSLCVVNRLFVDKALDMCYDQESYAIETTGYRKKPGHLCQGGWKPNEIQKFKQRHCFGGSDEMSDDNEKMRNAIISVISMVVFATVFGMTVFFLHKLQILRKQIPTYRYSKLNQDEHPIRNVDDTNETLVDLSSSEDEGSPAKLLVQSQTVFSSNHHESNGFIPDTPLRPVNDARASKSFLEDTDDELLQEV